jgi:putative ABC transport system permease protein
MGGVPNITLSADSSIFAFYSPVITLAVIAILVWLVISYKLNSEWGLAGRSVGLNPRLAGSYGVSIKQVVMLMLMISNGLIGFAGGLFAQNQDFVDISSGVGTVIIGLAAVVIGEKLFNCRSITMAILSCILGSVIYRFIISAALYGSSFGLATSDLNLVTGLLVIAAQMLPKVKRL